MSDIKYFSTNHQAPEVSFHEALLKGLAPDKGLYMPGNIPVISPEEWQAFHSMSYAQIAANVLGKFIGYEINHGDMLALTEDAYNFDVPLEKVYDHKYILRLDQGPTASFKDFAARMMGRLMNYFLEKENRNMLILTATSGDTGSAIANAFYGLDNIKVVILYPENEVTDRQRKQMTTLDKNISIIALDGKFDDCQAMVKKAFADPELDVFNLSSANSINIGRLVPQSVYYIYSYAQLCDYSKGDEIVFSVPSGNFGNLMGGLLAMKMGLPVKKFVIATNANDEVPVYFNTKQYKPIVPSVDCISSAMNVGHPSNWARIVTLYGGQMDENGNIIKAPDTSQLENDMYATSVADETTRETLQRVYERHKVILEPHGAVAWEGLRRYLKDTEANVNENQVCVSLETAHPAKFPAEINELLGFDPELSESLKGLDDKAEKFIRMKNNYNEFKTYITTNF